MCFCWILSKLNKLTSLYLYSNPIYNKRTPNAVHKSELDFKVGDAIYEVWVIEGPSIVSKGDLDGNGYFSLSDFALIRMYLLYKNKYLSEKQLYAADINSDGTVDSVDYAIMRQLILGKNQDLINIKVYIDDLN